MQLLHQLKKLISPGKSPFFLAAELGRGSIMDHLLETKWGEGSKRNNAKMKEVIDIGLIDLPDNKGNTCLHAAVKR